MKKTAVALFAFLILCGIGLASEPSTHRIGGGVHYWRTIDSIKEDDYKFDDSGVVWLVSYQFAPLSLVKLEADVEIFPDGFGGFDKTTFAPQAYVVIGSGIYAAGGIGVNYSDGDFGDDPFYALKAGLDIEILPSLRLDINANYRFIEWNDIKNLDKNINTDTVTLGAAVRLAF